MGFFRSNEQFTERRNKKRGDPFNRSFTSVLNLFGRPILLGCKEMAWWLSESEGVSEAEARVITATLEIEILFYVISLFGRWVICFYSLQTNEPEEDTQIADGTSNRASSLHFVFISRFTASTTWQFADYPYTTGTQKAAKISNKNSQGITKRLSFHYLLTNSCHRISTNGKAPPHSHINLQHPTISQYTVR